MTTSGAIFATDQEASSLAHYPISKLAFGVLNTFTLVSSADPFPVYIVSALPAGTNAIGKLAANDGVDIGDVTINNASGASAVNIQDGGNTITVDGTVNAAQSGTWNITNISGTVSLPTGAATAAKQPALGTAGTASNDVITVQGIASMTALKVDGSAVTQPVSIASTVTIDSELPAAALLGDNTTNPTVPGVGAFGMMYDGTTWDRLQGTSADGVLVNLGSNNDVTVTTLPASTNTLEVVGDVAQDAPVAGNPVLLGGRGSTATPTAMSLDGDAVYIWTTLTGAVNIADAGGSITVDNGGTFAVQAAQSGTWNITNISGPVSLPTGAATAAKQPALGTAGAASTDVITVQGIASMTALKVDGSAVTQPVSIASLPASTSTLEVVGDVGSDVAVAGNPLLIGGRASAAAPTDMAGDGRNCYIWTTLKGAIHVADAGGSLTIDNAQLSVVGGGTEAAAMRVTIASDSTGVLSVDDNGGALTVDNGGTFAVQPGGSVAHDAAASAVNPVLIGGYASAAAPTNVSLDTDSVRAWHLLSGAYVVQPSYAGIVAVAGNGVVTTGTQRVTLASDSTGQVTLATGSATIGALTANQSVNVAQINGVTTLMGNGASGTGAQRVTIANDSTGILAGVTTVTTVTTCGTVTTLTGGGVAHDGVATAVNPHLIGGYASAAAPTNVSLDGDSVRAWHLLSGAYATQPTYAGVLAVAGNGASGTGVQRVTLANDSTGILAGVTTVTTVTTCSTVTNLAQLGGAAIAMNTGVRSAGTQRVTIATDDVVPSSQSGTWTVQPGNTANTTPWLVTDTPATSGGLTKFHLVGAATTNATNIKASAGQVFAITAFNVASTPRYLKFHNTAGTPTAGTGVTDTYLIPGNTTGAGLVLNIDKGVAFSTGIAITTVTGIADADTAAIGASEVVLNIYYK